MAASASNSTSGSSNIGWYSWFKSYLPGQSSSTSAVEIRTTELASQITTASSSGTCLKEPKRLRSLAQHIPAHDARQQVHSFALRGVQSVKWILNEFTGIEATDTHLDFSNNIKISDDELMEVIRLNPLLEGLNLQGCYRLTEKSFACLTALTNLKYLNANYCTGLSVDALKCIPMSQMMHLELRGYSLSDDLISALFSDSFNLVYLDLACYTLPLEFTPAQSIIGDESFAVLSTLTKLEYLNLSYLQYKGNGTGLMALGQLGNLATLNLMIQSGNIQNEVAIYQMFGRMENLRILNPPMLLKNPESIQGLQDSQLEELNFPFLNLNISNQLQYLPLTLQKFSYNPSISTNDTAFYSAIGRLTNLRSLNISDTFDSNLAGQYWGNIRKLEEFYIEILQNSLETLCGLNPNLSKISISLGRYDDISPVCKLPLLVSLEIYGMDNPNALIILLAKQDPVPPLSVLMVQPEDSMEQDDLVNEGMQALTAFSKTLTMTMVQLSNLYNPVFDEKVAVASLSQLTGLTTFFYQCVSSIESCAAIIAPMKQLVSLTISPEQTPTSTESCTPLFQAIGGLPHLNNVSLLNCYGVQNGDFMHLVGNLELRLLDMEGVSGFDDGAVEWIETVRSLSSFSSLSDDSAPISSQALTAMQDNLHLQVCQGRTLPG